MHRLMRTGAFGAGLFALLFSASVFAADWHTREWSVMTTRAELQFRADGAKPAQVDAVFAEVVAEFERINAVFSPWLESSELARINREAAQKPVPVTPEMFAMFEYAGKFNQVTHGAFDASFAAAGKLYDYREKVAPGDRALRSVRDAIGWQHIELDAATQSVRYNHPWTRVDFGGIAKGYAIDRAVEIVRAHGITDAYVALGGDSFLLGEHDGRPWQVGIRHPRDRDASPVMLPASNVAISTSGDYERFFERDGVRIHHILSPKTGKPVYGVVSVTIIADDSTTADALSTGVFVLGKDQGLALVNSLPGISVIIIADDGQVYYSDDLTAGEPESAPDAAASGSATPDAAAPAPAPASATP